MWAARQGYMTIIVDLLQVSGPRQRVNVDKRLLQQNYPTMTSNLSMYLCGHFRQPSVVTAGAFALSVFQMVTQ